MLVSFLLHTPPLHNTCFYFIFHQITNKQTKNKTKKKKNRRSFYEHFPSSTIHLLLEPSFFPLQSPLHCLAVLFIIIFALELFFAVEEIKKKKTDERESVSPLFLFFGGICFFY